MSGDGAPEIQHTDGTGLKVTIVAGQWHDVIATGLLEGAIRALTASGVAITVVRVPGSFELPVVSKAVLEAGADAVVALGVIIRGGTPHFEYVSDAATSGLTQVSLATGKPAQFGVTAGGTAYMIPAYIKGAKRAAAIKFLQYVSSPKIQSWLDKTGGIPAVTGLTAPPGLEAMNTGPWAAVPPLGQSSLFQVPAAIAAANKYEGYLLGTTSLKDALKTLNANGIAWSKEQAVQGKWTEDWATK